MKSVLRVYSIEVPAREKDDLKEEPIVIKLRKVRPPATCDSSHAHGLRRLGVQATMAFNRAPSFTFSSPCTILSSLQSVIFV